MAIEEVDPVHHIVSNFQSILNDETVPPLNLPTNFVLNPFCLEMYFKEVEEASQQKHALNHLITKFILHHHNNPMCIPFLQLPHNAIFLLQLAKENYFPKSTTFQRLRAINRLISEISKSETNLDQIETDSISYTLEANHYIVDTRWTEETEWSAAFITPQDVYIELDKLHISVVMSLKEIKV